MRVLAKVSGKSENDVTREWLTGPIGMTQTKWPFCLCHANGTRKPFASNIILTFSGDFRQHPHRLLIGGRVIKPLGSRIGLIRQ